MKFQNRLGEIVEFQRLSNENCSEYQDVNEDTYQLIWFVEDGNRVLIDGEEYSFGRSEIIFLTYFHKVRFLSINGARIIRFNRPFYCIKDKDSEVGCNGLLFYGSIGPARIMPGNDDLEILETVWRMSLLEFKQHDDLQLDMLRMMLKRILILCTRIYRKNTGHNNLSLEQHNLVRSFNYLVETHFKQKRTVSEYADMLNKSPKTISNVFKLLGVKNPLQYIHDRIMLEAKRLLWHSSKDISEIGYDLGFNDLQSFSKFYKKQKGISPSECRAQSQQILTS